MPVFLALGAILHLAYSHSAGLLSASQALVLMILGQSFFFLQWVYLPVFKYKEYDLLLFASSFFRLVWGWGFFFINDCFLI